MAKDSKGRLNIQGLARRSVEVVGNLLPDPGNVVVSMDLASGEPTTTSHYSGDEHYRYFTLDGVGKRPEYRNGVLMLDDIYLAVMSVSPIGKQKMADLFKQTWPAGTFADQWLVDSDVIKKKIKSERQLHKILCLGIGYGMQPKKLTKTAFENGYNLSFKDAKAFYHAYWDLFSGVRSLADRLAEQVKEDGYLVNEFGYRLTPEPRTAFNYFIQSSVSGVIHVLLAKLFAMAPYAKLLTIIHDEILAECPADRLEDFRKAKEEAAKSLNEDLNWTVQIRVGFAEGHTWYEAK